jgi:hypothetical protein
VLGVPEGRIAEHGVNGRQPGVPGAGAVSPLPLEVVEEVADQRGVQVGDVEPGGLLPGACCGERQQQPPGVAIGGDGLRACVTLPGQPVGKNACSVWASAVTASPATRRAAARLRPSTPVTPTGTSYSEIGITGITPILGLFRRPFLPARKRPGTWADALW